MKTLTQNKNLDKLAGPKGPSKKQLIIEAWLKGQRDLWKMAEEFETQPSYIASTLQKNGFISGYYDLYTTPASPLNIYFSELKGKMGFKDIKTAQYSVRVLEGLYRRFEDKHDRAGQHHCLVTALTMFDRARFSNKQAEAKVFKVWLLKNLLERPLNERDNLSVHH